MAAIRFLLVALALLCMGFSPTMLYQRWGAAGCLQGEETATGDTIFMCNWSDDTGGGTREQDCDEADNYDWDDEQGTSAEQDGASAICAGADSIEINAILEWVGNGGGMGGGDLNENVFYQRTYFKVTAHGALGNGDFNRIMGYRNSASGIRGYLQVYRTAATTELRCRFPDEDGNNWTDCGPDAEHVLNYANCYWGEIYFNVTTEWTGWRVYEQVNCAGAYTQVIGAGGAFDQADSNLTMSQIDEEFLGQERGSDAFTFEVSHYHSSRAAIGAAW